MATFLALCFPTFEVRTITIFFKNCILLTLKYQTRLAVVTFLYGIKWNASATVHQFNKTKLIFPLH